MHNRLTCHSHLSSPSSSISLSLSLQNAIDLDQKAMESQLGLATDSSYTKAKEIYEKGAHSKSIAEVTITGGAPGKIPAGTEVKGKTASGDEVRGKTEGEVASGASTLRIQYATTDIQDQYVNCQVGALGAAGNTDGCKLLVDCRNDVLYTFHPSTHFHLQNL